MHDCLALVEDLRDLKSMSDDMNRIVYEQQEFFDAAEKNIVEADEHVASGTSELALVRHSPFYSPRFSTHAMHYTPFCLILTLNSHSNAPRRQSTSLRTERRSASL